MFRACVHSIPRTRSRHHAKKKASRFASSVCVRTRIITAASFSKVSKLKSTWQTNFSTNLNLGKVTCSRRTMAHIWVSKSALCPGSETSKKSLTYCQQRTSIALGHRSTKNFRLMTQKTSGTEAWRVKEIISSVSTATKSQYTVWISKSALLTSARATEWSTQRSFLILSSKIISRPLCRIKISIFCFVAVTTIFLQPSSTSCVTKKARQWQLSNRNMARSLAFIRTSTGSKWPPSMCEETGRLSSFPWMTMDFRNSLC